jgi:hypothetical protein
LTTFSRSIQQEEYEIVPQIISIALFKTHVIPGDQIKFYASIKYKTKMSNKLLSFTHPAGYATTPDTGSQARQAFLETVSPKTFSSVACRKIKVK